MANAPADTSTDDVSTAAAEAEAAAQKLADAEKAAAAAAAATPPAAAAKKAAAGTTTKVQVLHQIKWKGGWIKPAPVETPDRKPTAAEIAAATVVLPDTIASSLIEKGAAKAA